MWDWLRRNAEPLGALGALATAFAAATALIVIPYQVGQADLIQRDQTAREIYREFLNLTVQKPELASADFCALTDANQPAASGDGSGAAYGAYVDYLLYTAEQMIDTSEEWRAPMASYLDDHKAYLCDPKGLGGREDVAAVLDDLGLACMPADLCN